MAIEACHHRRHSVVAQARGRGGAQILEPLYAGVRGMPQCDQHQRRRLVCRSSRRREKCSVDCPPDSSRCARRISTSKKCRITGGRSARPSDVTAACACWWPGRRSQAPRTKISSLYLPPSERRLEIALHINLDRILRQGLRVCAGSRKCSPRQLPGASRFTGSSRTLYKRRALASKASMMSATISGRARSTAR